jgi:hypothetical protein
VLRADGGSIYLVESDQVRFKYSQNDTITFRPTRDDLPKDEHSMAGYVASRGETLNIPDAYALDPSSPYKPNFAFDQETGYRTRSVLLVPMTDRDGDVIGVLALFNRKQNAGVPLASFDLVGEFTETHAASRDRSRRKRPWQSGTTGSTARSDPCSRASSTRP